jgi:hypothetical protein
MKETNLRRLVRQILREEIGRNYHTINPDPITWSSFQDFEINYYPQADGFHLMDVEYKGNQLGPTTRHKSYEDAEHHARMIVDKYRVEVMNSESYPADHDAIVD